MKKFITNLGIIRMISHPISLLCDNNGTIARARSHQNSNHILRGFHLIREIIAR